MISRPAFFSPPPRHAQAAARPQPQPSCRLPPTAMRTPPPHPAKATHVAPPMPPPANSHPHPTTTSSPPLAKSPVSHTNLIRKLRTYIRNFRLYIRNLRMYIRNLRIYFAHQAMSVYIPPSQGLHSTLCLPASDNRQTQAARHTSPHSHGRDATMGMAIKNPPRFIKRGGLLSADSTGDVSRSCQTSGLTSARRDCRASALRRVTSGRDRTYSIRYPRVLRGP